MGLIFDGRMGEDFQHNTGVSANFGNRSREQTLLFNIAGSLTSLKLW
ncbi:hypothetical protein [Sphingopyxis sp. RIFCSPHIGHO2_12_FULL_65_19]|nr:hypothetical protein [Sphingopyxis sp. RIFCSPHIGHO2_12_FULL_65_19]